MQRHLSKVAGSLLCLLIAIAFVQPIHQGMRGVVATELAAKRAERMVEIKEVPWTLNAVGDIMLSRFVATMIEREADPLFPFDQVSAFLQDADITFANLENPIAEGAKMPETGLLFRADPEMAPVLRAAGFDIVSLANNHMTDRWEEGLLRSREILWNAGIANVGAGANETEAHAPAYLDVHGKRVAFLAYGDPRFAKQVKFATAEQPGIALANVEHMKTDIASAKANADVVIVSLHAGIEYRNTPDLTQQALAHGAIDAGADLVLGHHPHHIQPIEHYNGKYIAYSLGNFVFDQEWSQETSQGVVLRFTFDGNNVIDITATPIIIDKNTQPRLASDEEAEAILERLGIEEAMGR